MTGPEPPSIAGAKKEEGPGVSALQAFAPLAFHRDTRSDPIHGLCARYRQQPIGTMVEIAGEGCTSVAVLRPEQPTRYRARSRRHGGGTASGAHSSENRGAGGAETPAPPHGREGAATSGGYRPGTAHPPSHLERAEHPRSSGGSLRYKENPAPDQQIEERFPLTPQEGGGSRQGVAQRKGTSPTGRLPPSPPVGERPRRHGGGGLERGGNAQIQEVLQEDVRTKMGDSLSDTGTQSLENWCPVCESKPVTHLHGLLVLRSQTEHASVCASVRVRRVRSHHVQRPHRRKKHMRPRLSPPGTSGSAGTVSRCVALYKPLL